MTIAELDEEISDGEDLISGTSNPLLDANEKDRIQAVLDKERPGVLRMLNAALKSLPECQVAFQLRFEDPARSAELELRNQFAIAGLRRFFSITEQNYQFFLPQIIDNYTSYANVFSRLRTDQRPADFPTLLRDHPEEVDPAKMNPAFSVQGTAMVFTPRYRERNSAMQALFRGMFSEALQGIQLHEMGHFYFGFEDGYPKGQSPDACLKLAASYDLLARQITFRHTFAAP